MSDAGSFNADLGVNLQFNVDGAGLAEMSKTIKEISKGKDLQRYWKDVETATDNAGKAIERYSKNVNSKSLAENVLKQINALKAITQKENLSELFPNMDINLDELIESAKKIVPKINSEFSVSNFDQAFKTFDLLKDKGIELNEVFSKLADYASVVKRNLELGHENSDFRKLLGDTDIEKLKTDLKEIRNIRLQAEGEFESFLNVNKIEKTDFWGDEKFSEYFTEIRNGSMTATDAIARFKTEYGYLLEESFKSNNNTFGLEQLQSFANKLDVIFQQVEETSNKINDIISNGVVAKSVENLSVDNSLTDSQRSLFGDLLQDEETLKEISSLFKKLIEESNITKNATLFNEEQFNRLLILFEKIESSLSSMKAVFVDVGDGEELSPLLKMIANTQSSVKELSTSVKGIGLNLNIDVGSNPEMEAKAQSKIANALQAYQRLFEHIKTSSAGDSIINTSFFEFDINQYDTMMGKLQAYRKFIENMRKEAKERYGKDVLFEDTDKSYWSSASAAMGQVTRAFNEMNNYADSNPIENLFGGKTDLTEVVVQLNLIADKLSEISTTASEFENVFKEGFNVTTSVEEIEKLTSRIKELEDELSNIKLNPSVDDKSNISSSIKDGVQGDIESSEMDKVATATNEAVQAKKDFSEANEDVQLSVDGSKSKLELEAELMERLAKSARKAADAKKEFVEANKEVKKVTDVSTSDDSAIDTIQEQQLDNATVSANDFNKAYGEAIKINNALNKTEETLSNLSRLPELSNQFSEAEKEILFLNNKLKQSEITVSEYNKSVKEITSSYSKLADTQKKRDVEAEKSKNNQLKSIQSEIDRFSGSLAVFKIKPDNQHSFDSWKNKINELESKIAEYQSRLDAIKDKGGIVDKNDEAEIKKIKENIQDIIRTMSNISSNDRGWTDIRATKTAERLNDLLRQNPKMSKEAKDQIRALYNECASGNPSKPLNEMYEAGLKVVQMEREAGREGKSFLDVTKDKAWYGWAAQMAGMFSLYDIINVGRQAIDNIIKLDTALIDLTKTTAMSGSEMENFYFDSNDVAKEMGVTTQAIIEQASSWSRLGYNTKEASTEMAKLSSKFAIISPGMETEQAQEGLVSIMKAWDIDVDKVESEVIDKINILGNHFAEENQDIVEGMKRSAAALASTGTTYQDAFALFTGAQEVLQNSEVTGRALRSISMRIHGYSENSEDGLPELDKELTNITGDLIDLTKTAEHTQGVSVFKDGSTTDFKSLVDYFGEINAIWDEMSQKQQNDFLQKAFGKTQAQAGSAIIQNYESVVGALEKMEQSAGSADAEMATVESSISFKLNALKETWVGTVQEMIDRGDVGSIIDSLTKLSEAIGWIVDKLDLFGAGGLGVISGLVMNKAGIGERTMFQW